MKLERRRNSRLLVAAIATAALALAACDRLPLYSRYTAVDSEGWQRTDSISFAVPALQPGSYAFRLSVRTTSRYPYTQLSVVVRSSDRAHRHHRTDTLTLDITDAAGTFLGSGTALHEYTLPMPPVVLDTITPLRLTVGHNMSQQALPGISDLGLIVERQLARPSHLAPRLEIKN